MKPIIPLCCLLLMLSPGSRAADALADLRIELPRAEWLLPAASLPMLQSEGQPLPGEQATIQKLVPLITQQKFPDAVALLKKENDKVMQLLETGDPQGQLKQLVAAGGFTPTTNTNQSSAYLFYLIGHTYLGMEKFKPAESAFVTALVALPDFLRVHESLGLMYLQTKRYDEARVHLARAVALGLNTATVYGALGYLDQQTANYWGAISAYQHAMMMEPDNRQWQQGLLYSLTQSHDYASALTLVDQLLQKRQDDADLWVFRASMALQSDRSAALSSLETAIRLGDDSLSNLQVCASLHFEQGSIGRAVALLEKGMGKGMEYKYLDQAMDWLIQKDEWEPLQKLLTAAGKNRNNLTQPEQSKLLAREASMAMHNKQEPAARTALQQALDLDPGNGDALMMLADIHRTNHNYNQADLLYQRASAYAQYRENARISQAQLAIDQDNYERALQLLREVLTANPARTDLRRNIDSLENLVLLRTKN